MKRNRNRELLVATLLVACHPTPPLTDCNDDLQGVWHSDAGDWAILDYGATLEGYPLFPDARVGQLVLAPRSLSLSRAREVSGELARRYTRGGDWCVATAAVHVTSCSGQTLELVLADPPQPLDFAPCRSGAPPDSRRERWVRE